MPITADAAGITVEGRGEAIEWAVKMERLPKEATLENRFEHGEIGDEFIRAMAREIASFHARAERGDHISAVANFETWRAMHMKTLSKSCLNSARPSTSLSLTACGR